MDTGQGGANDNLFYANDFSFAPTNALEATFSRNTFIANRAEGSEYGLWAGYSYDSKVIGNDFSRNRTGIAIEHGQNNEIVSNRFLDDSVAINLWANAIEPSDWGYPKQRDTRSRDYRITGNMFSGNRVGFRLDNTRSSVVRDNVLIGVDSAFVLRDSVDARLEANDTTAMQTPRDWAQWRPPLPTGVKLPSRIPGGLDPARDLLAQRDRSAIIVDEWGPFDWRSPKLWPADSAHKTPMTLRIIGPAGRWRFASATHLQPLSRASGATNDTIAVVPTPGFERDWRLHSIHRGRDRFTAWCSPGCRHSYRFSYTTSSRSPAGRWISSLDG
jgi:parallel beta-helix repeat protein